MSDFTILAPPVQDAAAVTMASRRLVQSRHSLEGLLGPAPVRREVFSPAQPDRIAIALVRSGKRRQVVGVIAWRMGGTDAQPLRTDAMQRRYGRLAGALRSRLHALRSWLLAPVRGSYVEAVWVDPKRRGTGVGTALMAAMLKVALCPVHADVRRDNHGALQYFQQSGFRPRRRPSPLLWLIGYRRLVLERPGEACSANLVAHIPEKAEP